MTETPPNWALVSLLSLARRLFITLLVSNSGSSSNDNNLVFRIDVPEFQEWTNKFFIQEEKIKIRDLLTPILESEENKNWWRWTYWLCERYVKYQGKRLRRWIGRCWRTMKLSGLVEVVASEERRRREGEGFELERDTIEVVFVVVGEGSEIGRRWRIEGNRWGLWCWN